MLVGETTHPSREVDARTRDRPPRPCSLRIREIYLAPRLRKPDPRPGVKGAAQLAKITINLALQGGGAHGAFTWGALDRLLLEEEIEIERPTDDRSSVRIWLGRK